MTYIQDIQEERLQFNTRNPVKENWFKRDTGDDVGFLHIEGLDQANLENDGMSLKKATELVEILLDALHTHIGDIELDYQTEAALHDELITIRHRFYGIAPLLKHY